MEKRVNMLLKRGTPIRQEFNHFELYNFYFSFQFSVFSS